MINGTVLNIPGSSTTQTISGNIYTDVLSFTATSLYNQTTVVCVADGDNKVTSNEATLTYQGIHIAMLTTLLCVIIYFTLLPIVNVCHYILQGCLMNPPMLVSVVVLAPSPSHGVLHSLWM